MTHTMVNNLFLEYFKVNFPNFIAIYTDGSVFSFSTICSVYIPALYIFFSNNLSSLSSSFTIKCYIIIEALLLTSNFPPSKYLIASDSISCLQFLISSPFNSHLSPLIFHINSIIFHLLRANFIIQFYGCLVILVYIEMKLLTI